MNGVCIFEVIKKLSKKKNKDINCTYLTNCSLVSNNNWNAKYFEV